MAVNKQVKETLQNKLNTEMEGKFEEFIATFANRVGENKEDLNNPEDYCHDFKKCAKDSLSYNATVILGETAQFAKAHAINPHDFTEAFLKLLLEGNKRAREVSATLRAFSEHDTVGFC